MISRQLRPRIAGATAQTRLDAAEKSRMRRLLMVCMGLTVGLTGAPAPQDDLQRQDAAANARERMECRREALEWSAQLARQRIQAKRGERPSRPPRPDPARPPARRAGR